MPRRMRFIVFFGFVTMLVLATGIAAGAAPEDEIQSTEAEIADAQERLMELRSEESDALAEYDIALHKMNELNGEIAAAEEDLKAAEEQLAEAQESLEESAAQMYKSGNVGFVDVLMGTDNFQEFSTRLELWMRMLEEEQAEVEAVREAKDELEERKSELETQQARRVESVDEALAHKENVTEAEAEAESYLNSLNGELQSDIEAEQAREARLLREAAEQAAAERAAAEQAAAEQAAAEQAAAEQAAAEQAAEEEAAAAEAERQAQLAAERAALAEERAAERAAEEEAEEQAAIEAAAAEQARDEARAAAREAERAAEEQAAEEQAAEEQAALEAERQAAREEERAAEEQAALEAEREAQRQALAEERASARAAEEEESTATATASASASADARRDRRDDSTATATASAPASRRSGGGGGSSSCGDDFGGVGSYVAEAGCDLQDKFGLRVTGIGYSGYHTDGMDLDVWTSDARLGNQVRDYAVANYAVEYTCWQDRYVNYVTGWEESCPGHMDHVHITFSRYD